MFEPKATAPHLDSTDLDLCTHSTHRHEANTSRQMCRPIAMAVYRVEMQRTATAETIAAACSAE